MRRVPLKRTGRRSRLSPRAAAMLTEWRLTAHRRPCARCGFRETPGVPGVVEPHHIVPLETLKRERVPDTGWYDRRNMLPLCSEPAPNRCHDRHENHVQGYRLTLSFVLDHAPGITRFMVEHHLAFWLLEREYA